MYILPRDLRRIFERAGLVVVSALYLQSLFNVIANNVLRYDVVINEKFYEEIILANLE